MARPIVVEVGAVLDASGRVAYRFTCAACNEQGAWHPKISDAEDSARRHNKAKHADEEVARA